MSINQSVGKWLKEPFDIETQNQVKALQDDPELLEDAFYTSLSFGTGGMRGIMGVGTNRINKYTLGKNTQGISHYLKKRYPGETLKVAIAFDCRHQSQYLAKTVADVFTANGIHAYLFSDLRPTPELSFAVKHLNAHCGIVITASHNPPKYNGYKVYGKDGGQLVEPEDKKIIKIIKKTPFETILFKGNADLLHIINKEIDEEYQKAVLKEAKIHSLKKDDFKIIFTPIHGTAITVIPQVLEKAGYNKVYIVKEQAKPDGAFPTVISPNPEEPDSLEMAVALANEKNADIVIGTDPDADRIGIVIKNKNNQWYYLNGNQIMMVFTEYLLEKKAILKELSPQHFIATTIVSSPIMKKIANHYGVKFKTSLTGFKWIAKLINDFQELKFVGGGEESFGYLVGDTVRDKDAVSASLLACEIGSEAKNNNSSFYELMVKCYMKYGVFKEHLVSITKEGKSGVFAIAKKMDDYRTNPPKSISGNLIHQIEDYENSTLYDVQNNSNRILELPKSNVIILVLEDGTRIALRPSGTEPKMKFYYSINRPFDPNQTWEEQDEKLQKRINELVKETALL
jgi:phosphoglucomutase